MSLHFSINLSQNLALSYCIRNQRKDPHGFFYVSNANKSSISFYFKSLVCTRLSLSRIILKNIQVLLFYLKDLHLTIYNFSYKYLHKLHLQKQLYIYLDKCLRKNISSLSDKWSQRIYSFVICRACYKLFFVCVNYVYKWTNVPLILDFIKNFIIHQVSWIGCVVSIKWNLNKSYVFVS